MRVLSLFDGISCLRVALRDRKVDWYGSAEIDVNAIAVGLNNWNDITPLGDVCGVKNIKDIDLLCGGSPCTDLSIARNNREGLKGSHSKLFYEWVRIWKETKPRWFILENVASMRSADRDEISKQLGVEPIMIDASLVSAQSRKRLFWTNIPVKGLPEDKGIKLKDILEKEVDEKYFTSSRVKRVMKAVKNPEEKANCLLATSYKGAGANGMTNIGHCGNSNSQANRIYSDDGKSCTLSANGGGLGAKTGLYQVVKRIRRLTPLECERLQGIPDGYTDILSDTQRYRCLGNAFNVDVIRFILSFIPADS